MKKTYIYMTIAVLLVAGILAATNIFAAEHQGNGPSNLNDNINKFRFDYGFDNGFSIGHGTDQGPNDNHGNQGSNDNTGKDKNGQPACGNQGFNCECQNFYNDTHYYTIAKWEYSCNGYKLSEKNPYFSYFTTHVTGSMNAANWTSDPEVYSVLLKAGNNVDAFTGGLKGSVSSKKDISHITFCGYTDGGNGGCVGANCGNGVPEYSAFTIGAAVLVATLGLIILRKR